MTVLVNTVKVRVLTEDGQTLPVQLSPQWSSASQMSAEVFEVSDSIHQALRAAAVFTLDLLGQRAAGQKEVLKAEHKVNIYLVGRWT